MLGAHSGTLAAAAMMMTVSTVSAFTAPMALRSFQSAGARSSLVSRGALKDFLPAQPRGRARVGGSQTTAVMAQERKEKKMNSNVREAMYPALGQLAAELERVMKEKNELRPFELPEDMGYVEATYEGDRCVIQNTVWASRAFRKMHIELATFFNNKGESTGLDVLHCVVFPDPAAVGRDVPMFGCDLVAVKGQITAAIVDLSPVTKEKVLADDYVAEFDRRAAPLVQFSSPRELPEFGKAIFSDRCQFIRPEGKEEESRFVKLCGEILALHCELAEKRLADKHDAVDVQEAVEGQTFYCQKQSENDKTRRILVQAFGAEWTDRYMSEVLFDEPPASP